VTPRQKRAVLVFGLIAAALVAGYFGLRSDTSTEVEPRAAARSASENRKSEPASSEAQGPVPPARAAVAPTNAAAAFHSLQLCASAFRELAVTNYLSDCKPYEGRPDFQQLYAQCLNGWMNVPNRKAAAESALKASGCGDMTDVEFRLFEATRQAAMAGDPDAQMCYLQANFFASTGESLFTESDVEEYTRVAPQFFEAAVRRGDWRIVQLMTKRSFQPGAGPVTQIPDIGKPETIYKMTKLLRLGASGRYAKSLDRQLTGMIHPDLVPEAALPAGVVSRGDAWAQQTFNEYFAGVTGLTEAPAVCMPRPVEMGRLPGPTTP
jgi:hypothetical protein